MKLSFREKLSYGLGAVGKDMVYMLSATYILYYYQDLLGVNAIAMGVILMAARVFDAFNDPIMGVIVAKTRTRWGKFRPWLLIGTLLNAVVLYMMFSAPPALTGSGLVAYAAIFYILWGVTYTMMDIPYWSMIPFLTGSGKDREDLTTLARSCAGVGSALITVCTMIIVPMLGAGSESKGFSRFSLIIAVLFAAAILFLCFSIKEKSTADMPTTSLKDMFRALVQNDQAVTVVIAIVLINTSLYITSNLLIYFFKYDIAGEDWNSLYVIFNAFGGGIQILSMMLFFPLIRKFLSTINVFRLSCAMAVGGYAVLLVLMLTGVKTLALLMIPAFFIFAAFGFLTVLTTIFLANTVDYGEIKNYRRDESVIFSMQTFVVKLASGLAAFIVSICLSICNLSSDTDAVTTAAASGSSLMILRLTMSVLPIIGMIAAFIVFGRRYVLTDEKLDSISKELAERKQSENA